MTAPTGRAVAQRVRYRYHFTDFRTGRLLATLPLGGVKLDSVLSGIGAGSGIVPLSDEVRRRDPFTATTTRRTCMWAERQVLDTAGRVDRSTVPWAGIVMSRARALAARAMKLDLVTWEAYFGYRLHGSRRHRQADKAFIFRTLASWAVRNPTGYGFGDPVTGVSPHLADLVPIPAAPGFPRADRTYLASDQKTALAAMQELAASGDGFDWRLVPYMAVPGDLNSFRLRLDLGYPRLGRTESPELRWSTERTDRRSRWGHVEDLTITEDGSAVANRVHAVGGGTGDDQLRATVDSTATTRDEMAAGYPLWETALSSSSTEDRTLSTVTDKAMGALLAGFGSEVRVTGVKVRGDLAPTVDSYDPGDDAALRVGEGLTGQPVTIVGQIVGRSIEPPEPGSTERVTLDVQGGVTEVRVQTERERIVQRRVEGFRAVEVEPYSGRTVKKPAGTKTVVKG